MINEKQIAADMVSAYQQQSAFEYMLAREMQNRGLTDAAIWLQTEARKLSYAGRRYREWM